MSLCLLCKVSRCQSFKQIREVGGRGRTFLLTATVVSRAMSGLVRTYFLRESWNASEVTPKAVIGKSADTGATLFAFSVCPFAKRLCLCL